MMAYLLTGRSGDQYIKNASVLHDLFFQGKGTLDIHANFEAVLADFPDASPFILLTDINVGHS